MLSRRQFLALGGTTLASVAGIGLYSWQVEPHWVELVRRPMLLEHLPPTLAGRTLLQVSDIHVGPQVSSSYLIRALSAARDLGPDFVCFTGDFVSYYSAREYRELARVLRTFPQGRLATVAALGNHDYGYGWRHVDVADQVSRVAKDAGMLVLRNEVRSVSGIQFAGLADLWSPEFGVFAEPPLRGRNKRYTAGAFDVGPGRTLYLNRGLGHLLRMRFNVRPELTLFTLDLAPGEQAVA